jgi:hypothetical protein
VRAKIDDLRVQANPALHAYAKPLYGRFDVRLGLLHGSWDILLRM